MTEGGRQHTLASEARLQSLLEKAAEEGAKRALASIGLQDEGAADDLHDLRTLLDNWRDVRKAVLRTIAVTATGAILSMMAAGTAWQLWIKSAAP